MIQDTVQNHFEIKAATKDDIPTILKFIHELAEYERLTHEVSVTEELLQQWLFGKRPAAEAVVGFSDEEPVAYALFFYSFSTFQGRPGLYLEDLYVTPTYRGKGFGAQLLRYLAKLAKDRDCGRFEWSVLDWNGPAISFYKKLGAIVHQDWRRCRVSGDALEALAK